MFGNGVEEDGGKSPYAGHLADMLLFLTVHFGAFDPAFQFLFKVKSLSL